jgi:hypothetical protein
MKTDMEKGIMKRKMKLGSITAVVVVGLMIASAFTSMAAIRTPTSPSPGNVKEETSNVQLDPSSISNSQMQIIEKIIAGHRSDTQVKSTLVKSMDSTSPALVTHAVKVTSHAVATIDDQSSAPSSKDDVASSQDQSVGDRAETFRYEQAPAVADNSAGNFVLAHHLLNDTYPSNPSKNKYGVLAIYGADNYGQTIDSWSDPYIPKYVPLYANNGSQPIPWGNSSISYGGVNETGVDQYYGFVAERNNPYTLGAWQESGKITIYRILGNPKNINTDSTIFRYRPWFGFMQGMGTGTYTGVSMTAIGSSPGLRFPFNNTHWVFWSNGTHKPYSYGGGVGGGGEPFGLIAYTVQRDSADPGSPYEAHIGHPCEINASTSPTPFPPTGKGVNAYMVTWSWTPPIANCTSASAAIDEKNKWAYFAFDPKNGTKPRTGAFGYIGDMLKQMYCYQTSPLSFDPSIVDATYTWTIGTTYDIQHPSIAGYNGAVVAANELRNITTNERYLTLWYNTFYNGSTWGTGSTGTPPNVGFTTVGTWNLSTATEDINVMYPHVQHYEGNTFYMLFIRDFPGTANDELDLAITYDGGATWGPAEGWIQYWIIAGGAANSYTPVIEGACLAVGDNTYAWEWDNTTYNPDRRFVLMDYRTGVITGNVTKMNNVPVSGATVDVYNKDRASDGNGYAERLGPVTTNADGYFIKKCLFGIEFWQGSNMSIIASSNALSIVNVTPQIKWDPVDYVNSLPSNLKLGTYYRDLTNFPFYWAYHGNETSGEYEVTDTGAATAQMILNYVWWNQTLNKVTPMKYPDQVALFNTFNTQGGTYLSGDEMQGGLNANAPTPYSKYGYFFDHRANVNQNKVIQQICVWVDYDVSKFNGAGTQWPKPGFPNRVPVAVPLSGSYENWVAIRGIHTNASAWDTFPTLQTVTVYGFWINDPNYNPAKNYSGLPGKTYMTIATFLTKFLPVNQPGDAYNGKYLAIIEPPRGAHIDGNADTVVYGKTSSEFTPAMKLVAMGGVFAQKTVFAQAAKNAVMKVLMSDVHNNFAQEFAHAVATKVLKTPAGYQVTFHASFGDVVVNMLKNGVLSDFTFQ